MPRHSNCSPSSSCAVKRLARSAPVPYGSAAIAVPAVESGNQTVTRVFKFLLLLPLQGNIIGTHSSHLHVAYGHHNAQLEGEHMLNFDALLAQLGTGKALLGQHAKSPIAGSSSTQIRSAWTF